MEPVTIDLLYLTTGIIMFPICLYTSWKLSKSRYAAFAILFSLTIMMATSFIYILGDERLFTENPLTPLNISLVVVTVTSIYIFSFTMALYFCVELYKSFKSLLHGFLRHEPGNTQIEIRMIRSRGK